MVLLIKMHKRAIELAEQCDINTDITPVFITNCEKKFKSDPANIIARNTITEVGSFFSTINSNRRNEISHIFLNSIKKSRVRATDQQLSGRCWLFAGLNIFRHILIHALDLENFEFSEVYLFFWDKLERSNSYIRWFIDHPEFNPEDRAHQYMVCEYMNDGGFWNMFSSLVSKYGLVPASAMKETRQSGDSEDMNDIIKERLDGCVNHITNYRNRLTIEEQHQIREKTMEQIYDTLVKFLGEPPKTFSWAFTNSEMESGILTKLTPKKFLNTILPDVNMKQDFVILAHLPSQGMKYYTKYRIKYTNNIAEDEPCVLFNIPIEEMKHYVVKSVSRGFGVWLVGDVKKSFNWIYSALDDQLDDSKTVFGDTYKFDKGERITMRDTQGRHAMLFTGFNLDERGRPICFQVENSWSYFDYEQPGLDGFLNMSVSWFDKYVTQIVVHKQFLSRTMLSKLNSAETIEIDPWNSLAPAAIGFKPPQNYFKTHPKVN